MFLVVISVKPCTGCLPVSSPAEVRALLTAYCLLPTAYCLLPTSYCLLPTAYCPCPLPTAYSNVTSFANPVALNLITSFRDFESPPLHSGPPEIKYE